MSDDTHPQVHLVAGEFEADVDEGLAPILRLLWEAKVETMSGCQNAGESLADLPETEPHMAAYVEARKDTAYIDFFLGGVEGFLTLVAAGHPSEEMWYRMTHWCAPNAWTNTFLVADDDGIFDALGVQISFPISDIPEILDCLQCEADHFHQVTGEG